jgi:uncharacterized membrane protein
MTDHKLTAISAGCVIGLITTWQALEDLSDDGLTGKEWLIAIMFGIVCAAVVARVGYLLSRRFLGDDDDE